MRALVVLGMVIASISVNQARAQQILSINPDTRRLEYGDGNGNVVVFDAAVRRASITKSDGTRIEATFDDVARARYTSPADQAVFISQLDAAISSPRNHVAMTSSHQPVLNLPSPGSNEPPRDVDWIPSSVVELPPAEAKSIGLNPVRPQCPPPQQSNCGCLSGRCTPNMTLNNQFFYSFDRHSPPGPQDSARQMCEALHRQIWHENQMDECGEVALASMGALFAGVAGAAGCVGALPSAGASAVLCFAGIGAAVVAGGQAVDSWQDCTEEYPGPPAVCRL